MAKTKMIQIRDAPIRLHKELMRRAKARGMTLTDYIQEILEREVSRPTREETLERLRRLEPVDLGMSSAEFIREGRREAGRE
jgi:antitoxin FitA